MGYVKADDVRSPKGSWNLIQVLIDNGPSTPAQANWSLAIGEWERPRPRVLAIRWNGNDDGTGSPAGNPQSRGIPTWFILPRELNEPLLSLVPPDMRALAKALLEI